MLSSIIRSKTIWLGALVALIPFFQALQALPLNQQEANIISGILGVLVVVNRFFTSVPLSEK